MRLRPIGNSDSFLQLIILFLIAFFSVSVFMLMAQGLINVLWGVNLFETPMAIQEYTNPAVVDINRLLLMFQHLGLFIVPAVVFAMFMAYSWKQFLGFRKVSLKFYLFATVGMFCALPLINYLSYLNQNIQLPEALSGLEAVLKGWESNAADLTKAIVGSPSFSDLLINLVIIAVLPAIGEEMIFRGIVLRLFAKWRKNIHWGVWLSAILFSALHMQFYGFLPRMFMGAFLGYLFVWSGSLWVSIAAHLANNALALIIMYNVNIKNVPEGVDEIGATGNDLFYVLASVVIVGGCLYMLHRNSSYPESKDYFFVEDNPVIPPAGNEDNDGVEE